MSWPDVKLTPQTINLCGCVCVSVYVCVCVCVCVCVYVSMAVSVLKFDPVVKKDSKQSPPWGVGWLSVAKFV